GGCGTSSNRSPSTASPSRWCREPEWLKLASVHERQNLLWWSQASSHEPRAVAETRGAKRFEGRERSRPGPHFPLDRVSDRAGVAIADALPGPPSDPSRLGVP